MNSRNTVAQEQDFLRVVALNVMIPLANERTLQAAYYILRGRKANQTVQDVHLYNLYPYYRMFPRFSKEDWDKIVSTLLQNGLVEHLEVSTTNGKPSFAVTEKGRERASEWRSRYQLDYWLAPFTDSGMAERVELFWHRLHLAVQTISQLLAEDMGFLPVVADKKIQQWVKAQVTIPAVRAQWKQQLGEELYLLWSPLPEEVQALLVSQLSGAAQVGKTLSQLAMQQNESTTYLLLQFRYGLAQSIHRLLAEEASFPCLSRIVVQNDKLDLRLTESAARTYTLIQRGLGINQIATTRKIKESTVEDHLAEIALRCPEWDYTSYLSPELGERIIRTSESMQTSRLRLIKDQLGANVSYLQIRLALARRQGESGI